MFPHLRKGKKYTEREYLFLSSIWNPKTGFKNLGRNDSQLWYFFLFSCVIAGNSEDKKRVNRLIERLFTFFSFNQEELISFAEGIRDIPELTPLEYLKKWYSRGQILALLKKARVGQYNKNSRLFCYCAEQLKEGSLYYSTKRELLKIPGVGERTTKFFLENSRWGYRG